MSLSTVPRRQGIFWIWTLSNDPLWEPVLPVGLVWIRGQQEIGAGGFVHWQLVGAFAQKVSVLGARRVFGPSHNPHCELSRSEFASEYVWKEDTRVEGTQFEFGARPIRVGVSTDWESVWESAKNGNLSAIPPRIRVVSYRTVRAIAADFDAPVPMLRTAFVFWGATGTGKSRRAWSEAGDDCYSKDPRSKFWCGYQGQKNVIFDEFRGGIDISHILRWTDRYPVRVEIKGSSVPLACERIWFTSNLNPRDWYPDIDDDTRQALLRRLDITHFPELIAP